VYRTTLRVDAADVSELLESMPLLKTKLSEKYRCLGTSTSFICSAEDAVLVKILPSMSREVDVVRGGTPTPSFRPYFLVVLESMDLGKLVNVWDTVTNLLKNLGLRYVLVE